MKSKFALYFAAAVGWQSAALGADGGAFLGQWLSTSDAAKELQPHWMTPLFTVTPRLEQEYRYDQLWQNRSNGVDVESYGSGKGLELIPSANTEVIVGMPAYQKKGDVSGWSDASFLAKYRFVAANEERGNYIMTGFLGISVPTGSTVYTNHHIVVTPTIAAGHGWGGRDGGIDVQSTLGVTIPTADVKTIGMPLTWNVALQGHVLSKLWPELEASYTYFKKGPNDGETQIALTAGMIAGRFEVTRHSRFIIGGGYQKAVSAFKTFKHAWIATARLTF